MVIMLCAGLESNISLGSESKVLEPTTFQNIKNYVTQSQIGRFAGATWRELKNASKAHVLGALGILTTGAMIKPREGKGALIGGLLGILAAASVEAYRLGYYTQEEAILYIKEHVKTWLFKEFSAKEDRLGWLQGEYSKEYFVKELIRRGYPAKDLETQNALIDKALSELIEEVANEKEEEEQPNTSLASLTR